MEGILTIKWLLIDNHIILPLHLKVAPQKLFDPIKGIREQLANIPDKILGNNV